MGGMMKELKEKRRLESVRGNPNKKKKRRLERERQDIRTQGNLIEVVKK